RHAENPIVHAHEFCHSMLDIVATYDPSGWGSKIPFFGSGHANEIRQNLLKIGTQVLLVLLDFREEPDPKNVFHQSLLLLGSVPASKDDAAKDQRAAPAPAPKRIEEIDAEVRSRFDMMFNGLLRLLTISTHPSTGIFANPPASSTGTYHVEVLV